MQTFLLEKSAQWSIMESCILWGRRKLMSNTYISIHEYTEFMGLITQDSRSPTLSMTTGCDEMN